MYHRILLDRCILFTVSYSNINLAFIRVFVDNIFINNIEIMQPKLNIY